MTERAYGSDGAAPKKPPEEGAEQPALETVLVETETRADDGAQLGPPLPDSTENACLEAEAEEEFMREAAEDAAHLEGSTWKTRLRKSLCARQPRMLHTLKGESVSEITELRKVPAVSKMNVFLSCKVHCKDSRV